jgi:histone H1/5
MSNMQQKPAAKPKTAKPAAEKKPKAAPKKAAAKPKANASAVSIKTLAHQHAKLPQKKAPAVESKPAVVLGKTKSGRVTKTSAAPKKAAPKKTAAKKAAPKKAATPKKEA